MGDDLYKDREKPEHQVFLREYQIGKYPLTNTEFAEFIQAGGYKDRRWWTDPGWNARQDKNWVVPAYWDAHRYNHPNKPVVGVSWYECQAYCRWRSAAEGQQFRLPSEAEWEKAARGNDRRQYPWPNKFDATRLNSFEGAQAVMTTTSVGIYPTGASPYGCLDMAGNVWEWVEDDWHDSYEGGPADGRAWVDNSRGSERVIRGGSFHDDALLCRSAARLGFRPGDRGTRLGFRLAKSVDIGP